MAGICKQLKANAHGFNAIFLRMQNGRKTHITDSERRILWNETENIGNMKNLQ
jgi:hypothetical protein